ncbi:MAG: hypothetical protein QM820_26185 [Minicystis sp.]
MCASDAALLDAYAPFVARGVPPAEPGVAASLRIRSEGLRAARAVMTKPDDDDDAGAKLASRGIDEYLRDVGGVTIDLRLRGDEADLSVEQSVLRVKTVTAAAQCARPGAPEPLPAAFWRLPGDADAAFFFQGAPPEVMRPLAGPALSELVESVRGVSQRERTDMLAAMRGLFLTGGPLVLAYGHGRPAAEKALEKLAAAPSKGGGKPDPNADKALFAAHTAITGWTLVHLDEPAPRWRDGLTALATAGELQNPSAPAPSVVPRGSPAPSAARPPAASPDEEPRTHDTWHTLAMTPRDRLPAGSFHFIYAVRPNPRYVPKDPTQSRAVPHDVHFFGAPDGAGTWIVAAEDEALARTQLAQALSGPPARALQGRADLAALRNSSGAAAGFVSIGGLVSLMLDDDSMDEMLGARASLAAVAALPHRGQAPIPITWTSAPLAAADTGGRGCRVRMNVTMGAQAIGDVLSWFMGRMPGKHP